MKIMPSEVQLRPGDRVNVPWGVDTFEGRVVETYQSGGALRVRVEVQIPGRDDLETVVLRAEDVITESERDDVSLIDRESNPVRYERSLLNAVISAVSDFSEPDQYSLISNWDGAGVEADAVIRGPHSTVVIDVKWRIRELHHYVDRLRRVLDKIEEELQLPVRCIVVSPYPPRAMMTGSSKFAYLAPSVVLVRWRDVKDNVALSEALSEVLAHADKI